MYDSVAALGSQQRLGHGWWGSVKRGLNWGISRGAFQPHLLVILCAEVSSMFLCRCWRWVWLGSSCRNVCELEECRERLCLSVPWGVYAQQGPLLGVTLGVTDWWQSRREGRDGVRALALEFSPLSFSSCSVFSPSSSLLCSPYFSLILLSPLSLLSALKPAPAWRVTAWCCPLPWHGTAGKRPRSQRRAQPGPLSTLRLPSSTRAGQNSPGETSRTPRGVPCPRSSCQRRQSV